MNPSIHFDGRTWRCVIRCSDYAMPDGVTVRSDSARPGESRTKNAMVIFDPRRWRPVEIYKMREYDELPRASCGSVGYEDMRIFRTDRGGLQCIAAALHIEQADRRKQIAEQVILSLDDQYDVVDAQPIRGGWSDAPQKNWVPFDHCEEPRFLYEIDKGTLFDDRGELRSKEAIVRPSSRPRRLYDPDEELRARAADRADETDRNRRRDRREDDRDGRALEVAVPQVPSCQGLRGGSQLVRIGDDAWLGIGHAMRFVDKRKYYWHVWYLVDSRGKPKSASLPMKLAPNGIEFAAGLAIDGDRVVVSFGVDDMEARLGETSLSAVLAKLQAIPRSQ